MSTKSIVCVGMTTWEGDYVKAIVKMMEQLGKSYEVVYVDYPYTWKDLLFSLFGKSKAPWKRMLRIAPSTRKLINSHSIVTHHTLPPVFPINWIRNRKLFDKLNLLNNKIIASSIQKVLMKESIEQPVMINAFNPVVGLPLMDRIKTKKTIYYCYDEIKAANWCKNHGGRYEELFAVKADEVITTSSALYYDKLQLNDNTHLVKNGVDFDLFNKAYNTQQNFHRKIIGYIGSVDDRIDYDLLHDLAHRFPQTEFRLFGRIMPSANVGRISSLLNMKLMGSCSPEKLVEELAHFDAGIIPFVKNRFTEKIYPLKVNEYLAAGIPVISTEFADLSDFENVIYTAGSHKLFEKKIIQAFSENNQLSINERIRVAKENSWENRAKQFSEVIENDRLNEYA